MSNKIDNNCKLKIYLPTNKSSFDYNISEEKNVGHGREGSIWKGTFFMETAQSILSIID